MHVGGEAVATRGRAVRWRLAGFQEGPVNWSDHPRGHGQIADFPDDASKKTDPRRIKEVFAGSSGKGLARAICDRLEDRGAARPQETHVSSEGACSSASSKTVRGRDFDLHRSGNGLPGQRQFRRAAILDRCIQTRPWQNSKSRPSFPIFSVPRKTRKTGKGLDQELASVPVH